jgi:NAD(P)H-quinone oxidoreductase subunit 5
VALRNVLTALPLAALVLWAALRIDSLPGLSLPHAPALLMVLGLGLVGLFAEALASRSVAAAFGLGARGLLLLLLYAAWHELFARLLPAVAPGIGDTLAAQAWIMLLFGLLLGGHLALRHGSSLTWVKRLYLWLYGGLFLDEWLTRLTLRVWPARPPYPARARRFPA